MNKKPPDVERHIFYALINGASYQEAGDKNGVAKSTVNRIANEFRKTVPDFEELRDLRIRLNKAGLSIWDVIRGINARNDPEFFHEVIYQKKSAAENHLNWAVIYRTMYIPCWNCGNSIPIPLESSALYRYLMYNQRVLCIKCLNCNWIVQYTPGDILSQFALQLLDRT